MNKNILAITCILLAITLVFPPIGINILSLSINELHLQHFKFSGFTFIFKTLEPTFNEFYVSKFIIIRYDILVCEFLIVTLVGLAASVFYKGKQVSEI